jgi:hypothetical protein
MKPEEGYGPISRIEVIGPDGREYVRYLNDNEVILTGLQDKGKTLKLFIEEKPSET